jgi:poly(A) polymerase
MHASAVHAPPFADEAEDARARDLAQRIGEVLDDGVVHVVGSRRTGCALLGADLDLVAVLPGPPSACPT